MGAYVVTLACGHYRRVTTDDVKRAFCSKCCARVPAVKIQEISRQSDRVMCLPCQNGKCWHCDGPMCDCDHPDGKHHETDEQKARLMKSDPKSEGSIRTVRGGLPSLGKRR